MRGRDPGPRRDMRITVKVYQVQRDKMWKAFGADSKIFFRVTCG